MERAKVSIIIPSFNSAHFVVDAVQSALNQTIAPVEVIIVDDGSTDNTQETLSGWRDRIRVIHQENTGLSGARNTGLRNATGEWIAFLDADDVFHPRKLELQLKALGAHPNLGMLGTDRYQHPTELPPQIDSDGIVEEIPLERLLVRNYFTASSVLVRRSIALKVGEFDRSLPNAEDLDYWQRTAEQCGVGILRLPLTGYRQVAGSLSRRPRVMEVGIQKLIDKLDQRGAWKRRPLLRRKAISHFHYSCAHLYGAAGYQTYAIGRMIQSLAWYPFPYARCETTAKFARAKRLAVLCLRLLRVAPPEPTVAQGGQA
jgi:glycosyltransferase involved in cell wall biosynthesis